MSIKERKNDFFNLTFVFFIFIVSFSYISSNETLNVSKKENMPNLNIDAKLQEDINEIKALKKRTRLSACMSLIRNNLNQKNKKVETMISNSKYDASSTYDFILYNLIFKCIKNINETHIEKVLNPENTFKVLKEIDKELFILDDNLLDNGIELNQDLKSIKFEIEENIYKSESEQIFNPEEEIGLFGFKLNKPGTLQYIFLLIGILLSLGVILGGFYLLRKDEKIKKKKKKNDKDD